MNKKLLMLCGIVAVFVVAFAASCGADKKPEINPANYKAAPESLAELLSVVEPSADNVKVAREESGVWNVAYIYNGSSVDNAGFVRQNLTAYINFCSASYEIDGVDAVRFVVSAQTTDARGNAATAEVFRIRMDADAFSAYNWAELKNKSGSFAQIKADCVECWIDPGLRVDDAKIFYRG